MGAIFKGTAKQGRVWRGYSPNRTVAAVITWLDDRAGVVGPVTRFLLYPVPLYVHKNILYSLGGLTFIALMLQLVTGLLLSFFYDPSVEGAYNSVDYITYQMTLGWFIRGLHVYNASAIVILAILHLLRTFFFSAYKKPREITWLSGVFLLLVTLAFAFTGYLLPWDQRGYWATKVGAEIAGSAPVGGAWVAAIIRGGPVLGQATLTRFYVIHVMLLPAALLTLIGLHIFQLRYHGPAPAITKRGQAIANRFVPFFPHWVVVDATLGLGLLILLMALSWNWRVPLEFPADPSSTDFLPRPEWYFLFLFQLLKYFPGPLEPVATMLAPLVIVGSMLLLPFLDRSEERRPWRKPITSVVAGCYVGLIVGLTILALRADQELEAGPAKIVSAGSLAQAEPVAGVTAPPVDTAKIEPAPAGAVEIGVHIDSSAGVGPAAALESADTGSPQVTAPDSAIIPVVAPSTMAPLSSQPDTLFAARVDAASMEADAQFWGIAPRLEAPTQGAKAALSGSDQNTGPVVTLQAVYDNDYLAVRAEWADTSESVLKNGWLWDGTRFVKQGDDDKLVLLWPMTNNAEFAAKGCAVACHQADDDENWWMGSESDKDKYDVWQWQAARTNPVGQANDEWWGPLTDPANTGSSRHNDDAPGGGYQPNIAADKRGPAFMHKSNPAGSFIFADDAALLRQSALTAGDVVPGYILAPFTGSRGDVSATGRWVSDRWVVVLRRPLNTANSDDARFIPGKRLPFGLAVMDSRSGVKHNVAASVLILDWK